MGTYDDDVLQRPAVAPAVRLSEPLVTLPTPLATCPARDRGSMCSRPRTCRDSDPQALGEEWQSRSHAEEVWRQSRAPLEHYVHRGRGTFGGGPATRLIDLSPALHAPGSETSPQRKNPRSPCRRAMHADERLPAKRDYAPPRDRSLHLRPSAAAV